MSQPEPWWREGLRPGNALSSVLLGLAFAGVVTAFWPGHHESSQAKPLTAEQHLAATATRLGFTPHGPLYANRLSILRTVCVTDRSTFHTFATGSMQLRTTAPNPDGAARLDDLFRAAVHWLCPEREAELPRLSGAPA